jgi:hypothetical protein
MKLPVGDASGIRIITPRIMIVGIVYLHGHDTSYWDVIRSLDDFADEKSLAYGGDHTPYVTDHRFLKLNDRLGVEWFNMEEWLYPSEDDDSPKLHDADEFKNRYTK